jgi:hypothetical protein
MSYDDFVLSFPEWINRHYSFEIEHVIYTGGYENSNLPDTILEILHAQNPRTLQKRRRVKLFFIKILNQRRVTDAIQDSINAIWYKYSADELYDDIDGFLFLVHSLKPSILTKGNFFSDCSPLEEIFTPTPIPSNMRVFYAHIILQPSSMDILSNGLDASSPLAQLPTIEHLIREPNLFNSGRENSSEQIDDRALQQHESQDNSNLKTEFSCKTGDADIEDYESETPELQVNFDSFFDLFIHDSWCMQS